MVGLMLSDGGTTKKANHDAGGGGIQNALQQIAKKPAPAWHPPQAAVAAPAPVTRTASVAAPTALTSPQVPNQYSISGYSGGAAGTGGAGVGSVDTASQPEPKPVSETDYLAGDSTYQAALAALKKTLQGYNADHDRNLTTYDTDYNTGLKNLGWNSDAKSWNQDDTNTAYGRSYDNQLNDFGSRDMLNSSFYGEALNDMLRQYNDQKTNIDTARGTYRDDQDAALQTQTDANTLAVQQARAESIARRAAGVAIS